MSPSNQAEYARVHYLKRKQCGAAREYSCACGAPAINWAYNHADPDGRITDIGSPYSNDPDFYIALCGACHRALDAIHKGRTCGTSAFYYQHRVRGEEPCQECKDAHAEASRARLKRRGLLDVCKHGHEFTPENTTYTVNGIRRCLKCKRPNKRRLAQLARLAETSEVRA